MNPLHNGSDPQAGSAMEESAGYAALGRIARSVRPLDETLEQVAVLAKQMLREAPETSVTLVADDHARTAAYSGDVAIELDEQQYDDGQGPCLDASVSGNAIQVNVDSPDSSYQDFRRAAHEHGVTHSLSVGLPAAGRVIGALNLYSSTAEPFSADSQRIAGTFAGFTGLVLSTLDRSDDAAAVAEQLQHALHTRQLISQAQGILIARDHCNREEAFTSLLRLSQEHGVKLHEVAQMLLDDAAKP